MKIRMTAQELGQSAALQVKITEVKRAIREMDELDQHQKFVGTISVTTSVGTTSLGLVDDEPAQAFELLYGIRQARLTRLVDQLDQLGITLED